MKRWAVIGYLVGIHVAVGVLAWQLHHRPDRVEFMRQVHARIAIPDGACLFLGDSLTQSLVVSTICDRAVNLGIGSQTTAQLAESMRAYPLERASRIYVMIGTNDRGPPDYAAVAAQLPEGVPVTWSAPPSGPSPESVCASLPDCTFVDTPAALAPLGDAAFLDGVHLSPEGYAAWASALTAAKSPRPPSS